jgi:hypothetical protein
LPSLILLVICEPRQEETNTMVITSDGNEFEDLPSLPENIDSHCLVVIDANRLLVCGGYTEGNAYSNAAYMFDKKELDKWTKLPEMPTGRRRHSCGVVRDGAGVPVEVVAAGGEREDVLDVVEIYNVATSTWKTGNVMWVKTQELSYVFLESG